MNPNEDQNINNQPSQPANTPIVVQKATSKSTNIIKRYYNGRMNRITYFVSGFILNFLSAPLRILMDLYKKVEAPIYITLIMSLFYILIIFFFNSLIVRRLHDIGKSGWFAFITVAPIFGGLLVTLLLGVSGMAAKRGILLIFIAASFLYLFFGLYLFLKDGEETGNDYGPRREGLDLKKSFLGE